MALLVSSFGYYVIGVEDENLVTIFLLLGIAFCSIDNTIRDLGRAVDENSMKIEVLRQQLNSVHRDSLFRDETWMDKDRDEIAEKKRVQLWKYEEKDD